MPESMRICGLPIAPADRMTSASAVTVSLMPPRWYVTPVARFPSISMRCTKASVRTVKLGRFRLGWMYASATDQRRPFLQVTW